MQRLRRQQGNAEGYIPDAAELFYEGHVGNQGDAVRWGEELGASIKDMGSFQGHGAMATPHGVHLNWATVTEGGFHVNANGKRFSNENAGYSEQALKVYRQPGAVAWAIWDERSDAIAMQQASHKEANDAGAIKRCDSIEAIARVVGCDARALAQTFADVASTIRGEKPTSSAATSRASRCSSRRTASRRSRARSPTPRAAWR